MKIKLEINNICSEKEEIVSNYIKDTIDAFMQVLHVLEECKEEDYEEGDLT